MPSVEKFASNHGCIVPSPVPLLPTAINVTPAVIPDNGLDVTLCELLTRYVPAPPSPVKEGFKELFTAVIFVPGVIPVPEIYVSVVNTPLETELTDSVVPVILA